MTDENMIVYDDFNYHLLRPRHEVLPRVWDYSENPDDPVYQTSGAVPLDAAMDELIDPGNYEDAIAHAHDKQIFPMYHCDASWSPGKSWDQNGLPYCWTWGITGCMMTLRELEAKQTKYLSPVSLGFTVNWQSRGNYLMSAIRGMRERGVCEQSYTPNMHSRAYRQYKDGWQENALLYRLDEYWDLDNRSETRMVQHLVTSLCAGYPVYIAHNWWGHALAIDGLRYNRNARQWPIEFLHLNSHRDGRIVLTGSKGVPDEAYALRSTLTIAGQ